MHELSDILGDVRGDGQYHSLKNFIQPDDAVIMNIASILSKSLNPAITAQDFVHRIVKYRVQSGEIFRYPTETLEIGLADCDDMSILLCSILRNYFSPESVYVAIGGHNSSGHAWVTLNGKIIESTTGSGHKIDVNKYHPEVLFNDKYAYSVNDDSFGFLEIKKYQLLVK